MEPTSTRLLRVLETIADGHYELDRQWRVVDMSPAASRHFQRPAEELIGQDIWRESGVGPGAAVYDKFHEAADSGQPVRFEAQSRVRPGEWYELYLLPHDAGLDVFFRNITDRKRAEAAALRTAEQHQLALEIARLGVWEFDESCRRLWLDARSRQVLGLAPKPAHTLDDFLAVIHPDDRAVVRADVERALEPDGTGEYVSEHRVQHGDGAIRWIVAHGRVVSRSNAPRGERRFAGTLMDVTAERAAQQALGESEARFGAVVRHLPDAVLLTVPEGRIVGANSAACAMFQMTEEEICAGGRERLVDLDDPRTHGLIEERRRTGSVRNWEHRLVRKNGERFVGETTSVILPGDGSRAFVVVRDVTERKRAEEALRRANAALEQADRRKDEFIAILSHELRNPLAPIKYALPVLQRERLTDAGTRAAAVIDRQVDHLTRLVDDLLDVSRITRGKIELRREHVTLGSVVTSAVEAASPAIAAARHTLELVVAEEPIWLHADPARIAQVITNLLNNSAKYTARGGRIVLEARRDDGHAVVRVRDNGMGIPADALPAVFEMFRQVNRPDKSQGGLGIGLALAKLLVEMHGGGVEARSAGLGQGSEFIVRLPVAIDSGPGDATTAAGRLHAGGRRLRVLVVDDNADLVEMLAMLVEASGHEVRKALDGRSALSAALSYRPDVILLDLGLPIMTGVEVAREIRQRPDMAHVRLVALTGWGQAEDRRQTMEAGFDDHLTKPADARRLAGLLARFAEES